MSKYQTPEKYFLFINSLFGNKSHIQKTFI